MFYDMKGEQYRSELNMIEGNAYIKKLRELQADIAVSTGKVSSYEKRIIDLRYEGLYKIYDICYEEVASRNKIALGKKVDEVDTLIANNGLILFDYRPLKNSGKEVVQEINTILVSLDSLDNIIGLK